MSKTLKNTTLYLSQIAISGVLMLISVPIIAHQLTPAELGQFVLIQVYASIIVGFANLGISIGYERNFFLYESSYRKSAKLISSAILFVLTNLIIINMAAWYFAQNIIWLITPNAPKLLLPSVLIGSSFSALGQYYLIYFKNKGLAFRYIEFVLFQALGNFLLILIFLFWLDLKSLALGYAWFLSNLILFFSIFIFSRKKLPISFNLKLLKEMLKISLPLTPKVFFGFLNTQFDKMMLGMISSVASVGIYNIGQIFASTIFQFMTALDRVFKPEIYRKLFANKHKNYSNEINEYILPFFYTSILIALIIGLFAKEIVIILLPASYLSATYIIVILAIYYASLFFGKITGIQLIYAKKTHIVLLLKIISILLNIALNVVLIIKWGIYGAALATTITGILMTSISYFVARNYVPIFWQWQKIAFIYGLFITSIIFILTNAYFNQVGFISLILIKLIFILCYLILGIKLDIISAKRRYAVYIFIKQNLDKYVAKFLK